MVCVCAFGSMRVCGVWCVFVRAGRADVRERRCVVVQLSGVVFESTWVCKQARTHVCMCVCVSACLCCVC